MWGKVRTETVWEQLHGGRFDSIHREQHVEVKEMISNMSFQEKRDGLAVDSRKILNHLKFRWYSDIWVITDKQIRFSLIDLAWAESLRFCGPKKCWDELRWKENVADPLGVFIAGVSFGSLGWFLKVWGLGALWAGMFEMMRQGLAVSLSFFGPEETTFFFCSISERDMSCRILWELVDLSELSVKKNCLRNQEVPFCILLDGGDLTSYGRSWQFNLYRKIWETREKEDKDSAGLVLENSQRCQLRCWRMFASLPAKSHWQKLEGHKVVR